jgi:hypothetical protein
MIVLQKLTIIVSLLVVKMLILLLLFNTPQSLLWGFLLPPTLEKGGEEGDFKLIKFT